MTTSFSRKQGSKQAKKIDCQSQEKNKDTGRDLRKYVPSAYTYLYPKTGRRSDDDRVIQLEGSTEKEPFWLLLVIVEAALKNHTQTKPQKGVNRQTPKTTEAIHSIIIACIGNHSQCRRWTASPDGVATIAAAGLQHPAGEKEWEKVASHRVGQGGKKIAWSNRPFQLHLSVLFGTTKRNEAIHTPRASSVNPVRNPRIKPRQGPGVPYRLGLG